MKQAKMKSKYKGSHESKDKSPLGDSMGTGMKNPVGKMARSYMDEGKLSNKPKKFGKAPKSLA